VVVPALPDGISIDGEVAVPGDFEPGSRIFGADAGGGVAPCSVGLRLVEGLSTAAHCGVTGSPATLSGGSRVGYFEKSVHENTASAGDPILDFAVVQLDGPMPPAPVEIADRPVSGVLTTKASMSLQPGTIMCFDGAESGRSCGPLLDVNAERLKVDVPSLPGDSGSSVFLVDPKTQTVVLVATLKGRVNGAMGATYLDAALEAAQATALVDAAAAKAVAGNPYYSSRVSPR